MKSQDKIKLVERYVKGKEADLINKYITEGPTKLRKSLGLQKAEWQVIFDYLVFEENLLYKCVVANTDFFLEKYIKHGNNHIRDILGVLDDKYNMIWDVIFDFIVISNDGLYYHVLENRDKYMAVFRARGSDFIRKVLGVWKEKYEENWQRILDFLLHAVCECIFSEQTFEHSLRAFSLIMNGVRQQRPICKSGIII